jgi:PAS domain S-box-containing protein
MIMEEHNHAVPDDNQYKDSFNFLFDQVEDYLFILDETGNIIRINKVVLEKLEYTSKEMINTNVEALYPLTRRAEVQEKIRGMREGDISKALIPLRTKSGKLIPLELRIFKGKWEGKNVIYGIGKDVFDYERNKELMIDITNRKPEKGDQKLKHIQSILDSLPFIAWMKDKNGEYIIVNSAFEGFYRIKNTEIVGKTDFDIFPHKIAVQHKKIAEELIKSKNRLLTPFHHEMGGKWLEVFVTPFYEDDGEVGGTIGVARNITERKQLEMELANQKRFLKTMLDTIPDYIFYKDINSAYLGCNKAYAEKYLGVNEDEVKGRTDFDLMKDTQLAEFYRQKDRETFLSVNTLKYEGKYILTDGRTIDTETVKTPFLDEQGNVAGIIGVARDITNRKNLEKQLRKQAEYAELLFRTVPNAVLSIDKNGKIIRWNTIAEEITGYAVAEVIGKECAKVLHGICRADCGMCRMITDSPLINKKCKIITKDGQIKHVIKSIAVLKDESGEISEKMECFEDITEMTVLEAELRESRERYAAIVNNAPQIVVIHKKGIVEFVNDAGMEVLGYAEDEFVDRHMKGFKTEDLFGGVNSIFIEQIRGEGCLSCEIELKKKSGELISVLLKGTGITYEREKAILAVMMDITESKQLNAKLRASEEKFRQLAETINEIFLITDMEGIVYVSPAYERISGMSCQSLLDNQHSLVELIHPADQERMQASFFQGLEDANKATNEEFRIIRPDGETRWLWIQSYPIRAEANNSPLKAASIVDITDRKKIEDKLWERERQTRIELLLAARVQKDSLPHSFAGDKVRVSAIFEPYSTVSGDFYNYKWFEGQNKLCGYIVDVSGHGVATALQTATFKMMLDNVLLTGETIEVGALQVINQRIMNYLYEDSFVALLYFEFDFKTAELKLISAGITLFLAAKPRECSLVPISGCYLGIIDEPEIDTEIIPLKAGEIYCMMSDGASDLIELCGIRKQESFTGYENWLKQLAESPERNDDFSVICVEILEENKETDVLEINTEGELARAQLTISEFLERNASSHAPALEVAINEAVNNGLNSGGRVRVKTRRVRGIIIIRVKDDGPGFNTKRVNVQIKEDMYEEEFDKLLETEGGRGIFLMRLFCDKVIYNAKGNEVLMMKKI